MTEKSLGTIRLTWSGTVARLTIARPPHNHVDTALIKDLADALESLDGDDRCRVVILASEGKAFCGGADLAQPRGLASGEGAGISPFYQEAARLFRTAKPIIAVVQGAAVGAGLGLAAACDFRVAAPEARFCANFVALGFHPGFGLSVTLPRLVGRQKADLMFLTARRIRGEEALDWGLADVLAPLEALDAAALSLANEIAAAAPLAVRATRAVAREGLADAFVAATAREFAEQARLMRTEDFKEGVKAVFERRPGKFIGR